MEEQAIINTMEVLETKPITDLVSEVTIKVCYVSDEPNPNKTVISREVGKDIAATLPGAPVAGFFNKDTGDFEEHSRRVTFKDGDFEIEDITRPYGFVSPVDTPWYQDFVEDGVVRTYLVCKAYLWTRQYEEAALAVNKGQSMELDENNMAGYYRGDVFIFTSTTLDKLCILGDAYAPCFSGAKIMANYAKQYTSLAEKLENTIGRRYYVMGDQLIQKPAVAEYTLTPSTPAYNYALELGWNLTDAIYNKLAARGADCAYWVKGVYAEGGAIFAILENRETMELVRCDLIINADDTVELAPEMTKVTMSWVPAGPDVPVPVENLAGSDGIPVPAQPAVAQYVGAVGGEPGPAGPSTDTDPAPAAAFTEDDDEKCPECGKDPCECDDDNEDYALKYKALRGEYALLQTQYSTAQATIKEQKATIAGLTTTLGTYRAQAEAATEVARQAVITEYSALLTEQEIAPVLEYAKTASPEDVEAKCAVLFAKKVKSAPTTFQLNLQGLDTTPADVPEFMRQAMEYEKSNVDELVLKGLPDKA